MKRISYTFLILGLLFFGCDQPKVNTGSVKNIPVKLKHDEKVTQTQVKLDFQTIPETFIPAKASGRDAFTFQPITEQEFLNFKASQKPGIKSGAAIKPDSTGMFVLRTKNAYYELPQNGIPSCYYCGYLPGTRFHVISFCGAQMCDLYLLDNETNVKTNLPSAFDSGIIDVLVSPLNDQLLVYSSYDGPDFKMYYNFRAEFTIYKIDKDKGIDGLKLVRRFETRNWSIEEMVWISNTLLALKVYEGQLTGAGVEGNYKYLKTSIE